MEEQIQGCKPKECAHYIGKDIIGLYRGRFIWSITIATVVVVILFSVLASFYHKSLKQIVDLHKSNSESITLSLQPAVMSTDSCYYVNDQLAISMREHIQTTESLLQLQGQKIQSDFTLLSIWAGILMIVFLVFSIYSIYKTDELIKQGHEGVKNIEKAKEIVDDHIKEIDNHVENELKSITETVKDKAADITKDAAESIEQIKKQADDEKALFKTMLSEKTKEFQTIYENYVKKLEETADANKVLTEGLITMLQSGQTVKKDEDIHKES